MPFSLRLRADLDAGLDLAQALQNAANTSLAAATATADLLPQLGRARPHVQRSLGHPDPGAMSMAYCLLAASAGYVGLHGVADPAQAS